MRTVVARRASVLVVALTLLWTGVAAAQQSFSVEAGLSTWWTNGYTKDVTIVPGIDPLSELRWRGTDALLVEGTVDLMWQRFLLMLTAGGGRPQDGAFIDDDFLQSNHQGRFSHTRSDVDGSGIFYVSADFGLRALEWQTPAARGYLDTFIGYQYWNEEYVGFGLTGGGPGLVTSSASGSTKVQTEDISFHSVRLGLRTQVPVVGGLSLRGTVVLLPFTHTRRDDIHHLRTDLKQDPSFSFTADSGIGFQADAGLSYRVWKELSIDVGYRFWSLDSGTGRDVARTLVGDFASDARIEVERGGPYLGVRYRF
jgi:hypothetical protein